MPTNLQTASESRVGLNRVSVDGDRVVGHGGCTECGSRKWFWHGGGTGNHIGIGLSEADDLVRKQQWTLDQMVCQWKLGNEAGLPQHVIGRVARYGQQRWSEKQVK